MLTRIRAIPSWQLTLGVALLGLGFLIAAQLASVELMLDGLEAMPRERLGDLLTSLQRGTLRLTRLIDNLTI